MLPRPHYTLFMLLALGVFLLARRLVPGPPALAEKLNGVEVFRITLTAFLDVHNFDTRRVMKCCLAHLLPSGHVVPFCAYNTLYRDGHVPLPPLAGVAAPSRRALDLVNR